MKHYKSDRTPLYSFIYGWQVGNTGALPVFSPLPSLARVGGCAVWSAARSSAIVGVLQAHRGLSDIIDNYCASRIGRAFAEDLHHSAAWPMMARHHAPCAIDEVLHRTGAIAEVAEFSAPLLVKSGPC